MKGSYCLIIEVLKDCEIIIGKLGKIKLYNGLYVYIGSALNNLEKRVKRHISKEKRRFWHIDYLLENENARVAGVYLKVSDKKEECEIAKKAARYGEPITGFGCSDCKCESHLFKIESLKMFETMEMKVYENINIA